MSIIPNHLFTENLLLYFSRLCEDKEQPLHPDGNRVILKKIRLILTESEKNMFDQGKIVLFVGTCECNCQQPLLFISSQVLVYYTPEKFSDVTVRRKMYKHDTTKRFY
jgi:hypothetical protein